ncbi:MAG: pseudaminic acid synthase [Bacteriovoracaceae bacterium]|jgi:pseudaminic acid synthase
MKIGKCNLNEKCFIIAELSANHNGNLNTAIETIKAAREVGADAIKFQTYTADTITLDCKKDDFKIKGTVWDGKYLHDLYKDAYTPWEWHAELFRIAREEGLECFSSPFDFTAVDFLEKLNVPAYKIASFEITDIPLIEYVAKKQKPIILSTGIASKDDIDLAIQTIKNTGNNQIALLKCTSSYPAPIEEANLSMIQQFEKDYGVLSGLSDHTLGIVAPVVAATLGAKIIEKHFILDRAIGGPDASFSLNKEEFAEMVKAVRAAESAVGVADYSISEKSKAGRVFSRSLYFCTDLKKGEIIDEKSIRSVRPGHGLHPKHFAELIGKKLSRDVSLGTATNWDLFEN